MKNLTHKDVKDCILEAMVEGGYSDSSNGKSYSHNDFLERVLTKLFVDKDS